MNTSIQDAASDATFVTSSKEMSQAGKCLMKIRMLRFDVG